MTDYSELRLAMSAVMERQTSRADLMAIAEAHPSLMKQVVRHPNADLELLDWLISHGDADTIAVASSRRASLAGSIPTPPPQPVAAPPTPVVEPTDEKSRDELIHRISVITLIVSALLLVVSLVIWFLVLPNRQNNDQDVVRSRQPEIINQPVWLKPIALNMPTYIDEYGVIDSMVGDIAIVWWLAGQNYMTFVGVDLNERAILWRLGYTDVAAFFTGPDGLVLQSYRRVVVIDPTTGEELNAAFLISGSNQLITVSSGVAITLDTETDQFCARKLDDLYRCLWEAQALNYLYSPQAYVFGDGRWINTGDGVRELVTGEAAPFGADATSNDNGGYQIFYAGQDETTITRIVYNLFRGASSPYGGQLWDVKKDEAVSELILGDWTMVAEQTGSSSTFLVVPGWENYSNQVKAYHRHNGVKAWDAAAIMSQAWSLMLVEDVCLMSGWSDNDYRDVGSVAFRIENGFQIWANQDFQPVGSSGRVVYGYSSQTTTVSAHDATSSEFSQLWSLQPPDGFHADELVVTLAANHLVAVSHFQVYNYLWVIEG